MASIEFHPATGGPRDKSAAISSAIWSGLGTICMGWISCVRVCGVEIDAEFPGGNVQVLRVEDDRVSIQPNLRDTEDWWFYWNFRVRGGAGRQLRFEFAGRNPIGVRGPAYSLDGGRKWKWLGTKTVQAAERNASFSYHFGKEEYEVRFAFAIPYQAADLQCFLHRVRNDPHLRVERLCTSPQGRSVERIHVGPLDTDPVPKVLVTARHHACETMASFVLEGILEEALAKTPEGRWLREHVELVAIPLMDKDGVEEGDQGKNRRPHDHWLDYGDSSTYNSVAAMRGFVEDWSPGELRLALDLHCPYLREPSDGRGSSERIFFVGGMVPSVERRAGRFHRELQRGMRSPLPFSIRHNLPYGMRWNEGDVAVRSFLGWAARIPGIDVATLLEIPYANANGAEVNPETARLLGHDIANAMSRFLQLHPSNDKE